MVNLGNFEDEDGIGAAVKKNEPWTKKYAAHDLDGLVLPSEIRDEIEFAMKENSFTDYIFHSGAPGTGKSSLAKVIPEMLGVDYKFFKCTKDAEIMADIEEFIMYGSSDGKPRFIIIDEADKPKDADRMFRFLQATISEDTRTVRFILTMNDFHRMPDAMISRCHAIEFVVPSLEESDYKNRLYAHLMKIAKAETEPYGGIVEKNTIISLIKQYFPDIRQMIVCMQSIFNRNKGSIKGDLPQVSGDLIKTIYDMTINCQHLDLYHYITANVKFPRSIYSPFGRYFVDHITEKFSPSILIPFGIKLADYQDKASHSVDQMFNLWGFLLNLMQILQTAKKEAANGVRP